MAFHDRRPGANDESVASPEEEEDKIEAEGEGTQSAEAEESDPGETVEEVAVTPEEVSDTVPAEESLESLDATRSKLRKDIESLRSERREIRGSSFQQSKKDDPLFVKSPEDDPLKDVATDDVLLIEKVLKAKGYVRKDELSIKDYNVDVKRVTETWLEQNPEFKPENDPDDENWNKLNTYASKFYQKPSDPKDVLEILDASRERLFGKKAPTLPTRSLHSIAAQKEKIAVSAKPSSGGGAGSGARSQSVKPSVNKYLTTHLHGFSDEELQEIASQ